MMKISDVQQFYDEIAEEHSKMWGEANCFPKRLWHFSNAIEYGPVVDVGCGSGRDLKWFEENNVLAIGIDISQKMLEEAKKRTRLPVRNMSFQKMYFADKSIAGIWACSSLVHCNAIDLYTALKEFHRILVPNGLLVFSVKRGSGIIVEKKRTLYRYTSYELVNFAKSVGFKVAEHPKPAEIEGDISSEGWEWVYVRA